VSHSLKQQRPCVHVHQSGLGCVKWWTRKPRATQWSVVPSCRAEYKLHKLKIGVEFLLHFFSNRPVDPKHPDSGRWSVGSPLNLFYRAWLRMGREKMGLMAVKTEHGVAKNWGWNPEAAFELLSSCTAHKSGGQQSAPFSRTQPKVRTHSNASIVRATITAHLSV
jgi:hypothetical protein